MRLTKLLGALVLAAASTGLASAVTAQTAPTSPTVVPVPASPRTIGVDPYLTNKNKKIKTNQYKKNRSFFKESGDFYRNRKIPRQINYIIGAGVPWGAGFPDLELERDAERITNLYRELLEIQVSSDPVLRTPDLLNPFNTSVRLLSAPPRFGTRLEGSEFIYETVPPR